jgi:hypothetical protein
MADNQELHPVIQLLLKRMESHPEEFECKGYGRWQYALEIIENYGSTEDVAVLRDAMRSIRLEEAHVWALEELCNGEERRRQHQDEILRYEGAIGIGSTPVSGKEAIRITCNGTLGIGTISPSRAIQIQQGANK